MVGHEAQVGCLEEEEECGETRRKEPHTDWRVSTSPTRGCCSPGRTGPGGHPPPPALAPRDSCWDGGPPGGRVVGRPPEAGAALGWLSGTRHRRLARSVRGLQGKRVPLPVVGLAGRLARLQGHPCAGQPGSRPASGWQWRPSHLPGSLAVGVRRFPPCLRPDRSPDVGSHCARIAAAGSMLTPGPRGAVGMCRGQAGPRTGTYGGERSRSRRAYDSGAVCTGTSCTQVAPSAPPGTRK